MRWTEWIGTLPHRSAHAGVSADVHSSRFMCCLIFVGIGWLNDCAASESALVVRNETRHRLRFGQPFAYYERIYELTFDIPPRTDTWIYVPNERRIATALYGTYSITDVEHNAIVEVGLFDEQNTPPAYRTASGEPVFRITVSDWDYTVGLRRWASLDASLREEMLDHRQFHRSLLPDRFHSLEAKTRWTRLDGLPGVVLLQICCGLGCILVIRLFRVVRLSITRE